MADADYALAEMADRTSAGARDDAVRSRIGKAVRRGGAAGPWDADAAEEAAMHYEMATIGLWKFALDESPEGREKNRAFVRACRKCFGMMEACPVPGNPVHMISHVMSMLAYARMGEDPEGARRYLKENARAWDVGAAAEAGWNARVLAGIYLAVLRVAGRETREDLERSAGIVEKLREERKAREKEYFAGMRGGDKRGAAHELASLYHLAESVEAVGAYVRDGSPADVEPRLDASFREARAHSSAAGTRELDILLSVLHPAFKKMARDSPWALARLGGRPGDFARMVAESGSPASELPHPQRRAVLEGGLLDPARGAVVVNMPASSGRTTMAEFRILQALESARGGTVAYVVPAGARVGRIAARLRRDLGAPPLGVRVEEAGGAPHVDGLDEEAASGGAGADVLVATPEKLHMLMRHPGSSLAESLVLAVVDGADGMDGKRGLALEMLLSAIKRDCARSKILLMAAPVPNGREVAEWLDPQNSLSIGADIDRQAGDRVVGLYRAECRGSSIEAFFRPLATGAGTAYVDEEFRAGSAGGLALPAGNALDARHALASLLAAQFDPSRNLLVLGRGPGEAWKMAELICQRLPELEPDEERLLARKFVASELGAGFPLVGYLGRGVGVYHAGLPGEVGELMEHLMEAGRLRVLAATADAARGASFPVSGMIVASRSCRGAEMPARDFWNLAGRAGRIGGAPIGVVGLVAGDDCGAAGEAEYVKGAAGVMTSALAGMVRGALEGGGALDLSRLAGADARWSIFAQHVAHAKSRIPDPGRFAGEAEIALGQTYGFRELSRGERRALVGAVVRYAERLDEDPPASRLSGTAGFSAEALGGAMRAAGSAGIGRDGWSAGSLFAPASEKLRAVLGVAGSIPEVKKDLDAAAPGRPAADGEIGAVISDWVSGRKVAEIAEARFGGSGAEQVTRCAEAVRGIAGAAARGMAAVQRMPGSGLDFGGMTREQRKSALNLPAMVYHGVGTDEAVVMRRHGVPRGAARRVGEAYGREAREIRGSSGIMLWLEGLPGGSWGPGSGSGMSGADYKEVWRRLAGAGAG